MGNDFNRPHEHPTVNLPDHLDLIATAPDGIQKLRSLILELAVRGKLVPQDPNDEPASELLKRIAKERGRLAAAGSSKPSKATTLSEDTERYLKVPETWQWVRFEEIAQHNSGKTLDKGRNSGEPRPYLTTSNLYWGRFELDSVRQMLIKDDELQRCTARKNDLLICEGGEAGRAAVWPHDYEICFQNHVHRARLFGGINPYFAYRFFEKLNASGEIDLYRKGVGISNMSGKALASIPFPVPPLAEQHRIVAKVDELMALCDRLDAEQADAGAAHARLVATLLGTLTKSADAADLAANWQRLAEHFDTLFTTESSLDALKQTILQLAVMGKLVPQGTGHADPGWAIKRLDKLCPEIVDCPHSTPKWTATGKLCVRTSQFRPGRLDLSASRFVSDSTFSERISRLKPKENDILYSREGGILGVACRVPLGIELCLGQRMMLIRPGRNVSSAFLELVLNSPMITQLAREKTTGGAAPRVNVATVKAYPIPIPPIDEQHRIVAKVDELMALCDRLKAGLAESRAQQECLATTLIESALKAA
jgi:type I restriction enzyme S subunit